VRDYLDIDALIRHGIDLPTALAAGLVVYGRSFNPMITLKALSFFDDLPTLPADVQQRLTPSMLPASQRSRRPELTFTVEHTISQSAGWWF
jgi:hypothetical protein